jgi:hypothetical protein
VVNSLLEIAGLALLVVAAAFVAIPLAIVVAGLELVLLANLRETRTHERQDMTRTHERQDITFADLHQPPQAKAPKPAPNRSHRIRRPQVKP